MPKLKDYESYIKRRSFNQALIRAEIVKEITLDLTAPQYRNDKDVQTLLNTKDLEKYRDTLRTIFNKNLQLTKQFGVIDQHYACTPSKDKDCIRRTVMFLTNDIASGHAGVCTREKNGAQRWGDMVIILKGGLDHPHTYMHELGHSFGLTHIFQENNPLFIQGLTDNFMDYNHKRVGSTLHLNPFHKVHHSKTKFCYTKAQWDIMRQDKSMK